jgi:alanyl-tRNA synthetase
MARERGLTVDIPGFETLMEEQRSRARKAQKKQIIELSEIENEIPTRFVGYDSFDGGSDRPGGGRSEGEGRGVTGHLAGLCRDGRSGRRYWRNQRRRRSLEVVGTQKSGGTWLHFIQPGASEQTPAIGSRVIATVDRARRRDIERHHSGTHLLHWALHEVVSRDATQKGSYVGPEKLTFDFSSAPLTPGSSGTLNDSSTSRSSRNAAVSWTEVPYTEIKHRPDVMQFFGDKYGEKVRVVQIGGRPHQLDGYSMELCGGTHNRATGEIGLFRITSEAAIAAGIRRIEAVAGSAAYHDANRDAERIKQLAARLGAPVPELERKTRSIARTA